ncbi:MAG TPA: acetate--CoA ligase family protein, partial [Paralcaligenes sp.]
NILGFARAVHERYPGTPIAFCAILPYDRRLDLEKLGCITLEDPSVAVRTISAILKRNRNARPKAIAVQSINLPAHTPALNEAESLLALKQAHVPVVEFKLASSKEEAASLVEQLNAPAAMKILSADIAHKSDIGGVKLSVRGPDEARAAYDAIMSSVARHAPLAGLDGMLIAPMAPDGVECIIGMHRDPTFGPVIMFGLGGIFVEILKDVSFRLAPFDKAEALEMIQQTRAVSLLKGARGRAPSDLDALAESLAALSNMAYAARDRISSIDINPFLVLPAGQGAMALDALILQD